VRPEYEKAVVAVAPLRFGAGVKGKVGEALALGVPMVITPLSGEGMSVEDHISALIRQNPEDFAEAIRDLSSDGHLWEEISRGGLELVRRMLSREAARYGLAEVLGPDSGKAWAEPLPDKIDRERPSN
jgi:glycosyltransferase involved in cell wall biosynthesis